MSNKSCKLFSILVKIILTLFFFCILTFYAHAGISYPLVNDSNPKNSTDIMLNILSKYNHGDYTMLLELRKLFVQGYNPNVTVFFGGINTTPLGYAIVGNKLDMLQLLLEYGANPNPQIGIKIKVWEEEITVTPLTFAVSRGNKEAVRLLLAYGADPNIQIEYEGEVINLLDLAIRIGNKEIIKLLEKTQLLE